MSQYIMLFLFLYPYLPVYTEILLKRDTILSTGQGHEWTKRAILWQMCWHSSLLCSRQCCFPCPTQKPLQHSILGLTDSRLGPKSSRCKVFVTHRILAHQMRNINFLCLFVYYFLNLKAILRVVLGLWNNWEGGSEIS